MADPALKSAMSSAASTGPTQQPEGGQASRAGRMPPSSTRERSPRRAEASPRWWRPTHAIPLTATLGTVPLAAGNSFTLDMYGDKLITLAVGDSIAAKVINVATGKRVPGGQ